MSKFEPFELRGAQRVTILMNSEKNYKIYRERLRYLSSTNLQNLTIIINGRESENARIRGWVREDQLAINVVFANIKINKTRLSRFVDKRVQLLNQVRFNLLLLKRFPTGHNSSTKHFQSKRPFLVERISTLSKYVKFTRKLAKIRIKDEVKAVLKDSDCVFFTFPVQQKSSEWQCRLVFQCASWRTRAVYLVASWDNLTNRIPSAIGLPGEIVVWADWQGEQAIELWGYKAQNVYILKPRILLPKVFSTEELAARSAKDLKDCLTIGYLGSSAGVIPLDDEIALIKRLIETLAELRTNGVVTKISVAIRLHPLVVKSKTDAFVDQINFGQEIKIQFQFPEGQSGTIFKDEDIAELSNFISESDVLIGINTSTMIEAQAGGAVVISMPTNACDDVVNHNFHAKQVAESTLYLIPKTYKELSDLLINVIDGHRIYPDLTTNARKFVGSA